MSDVAKRRRIGVVTSSRADYSHLYWPLCALASDPSVELGVFVMGPHLSPAFGMTVGEMSTTASLSKHASSAC